MPDFGEPTCEKGDLTGIREEVLQETKKATVQAGDEVEDLKKK